MLKHTTFSCIIACIQEQLYACIYVTQASTELHGIDWDAPLATDYSEDDIQTVSVEAPLNPLTEEQYSELQTTLPPVIRDSSSDYGLTLFLDCIRFVQIRLV